MWESGVARYMKEVLVIVSVHTTGVSISNHIKIDLAIKVAYVQPWYGAGDTRNCNTSLLDINVLTFLMSKTSN